MSRRFIERACTARSPREARCPVRECSSLTPETKALIDDHVGLERLAWSLLCEALGLEVEAPSLMREARTLTREALRVTAEVARLTRQARSYIGQTWTLIRDVLSLIIAVPRLR